MVSLPVVHVTTVPRSSRSIFNTFELFPQTVGRGGGVRRRGRPHHTFLNIFFIRRHPLNLTKAND